ASGLDAHQVVAEITRRAKELTARQAAIWQDDIRPKLAEHHIESKSWQELDEAQQEGLTRTFRHQIYPVLTPLNDTPPTT
ncbi:Polyphosphate kinase, partial [human gut metagenome]